MKIVLNKEGLTGEALDAAVKLEKNLVIEDAITKEEIAEQVQSVVKGLGLSKENVTKLVNALDSDNPDTPFAEIKALRTQVDELIADAKKQAMGGQKSQMFSKEEYGAIVKAVKEGRPYEAIVKTPAIMTTANFLTGAPHSGTVEVDTALNAPIPPEMAVFNRLLKGSTNARTIYWTNRVNEEGGAAFIAQGALKPLKDWERIEANSVAKKVAVMATLTTETLEDVAMMEQEVNEVLRNEVMQEIADAVLTSTESATALKGIIPSATSYTTTALDGKIASPNAADAIRAGMLQLRLLKHVPDVVFLNPGDAALLDLTKDTTGNYLKLQTDGVLQKIDVVETTEIIAGKYLLMDSRKWKLRIYKGITSKWGLNGEDFSYNRVSVLFEARLHSYINSIDAGAVLYGDFTTITGALAKS